LSVPASTSLPLWKRTSSVVTGGLAALGQAFP
jgi:hypothetical protein